MVTKDSGYLGKIRSLAGVLGKQGLGIEFNTGGGTAAALLSTTRILEPNPSRIYAWIQNVGAVELCLGMNDQSTTLYIQPWDIYVIDALHPWTGAVTGGGNGDTCLYYWGEYSLAGV